ncbi:hypothetical protein [Cupriavidus sp. USMAHM13]|uniref:hypothetical protein n=1 Tax=Cupriavidus sp. USMAHM13 TaxID=1389192 RepID=UPI000AE0142D|nr:hypothetical protein [Cupriavidus sp. USMAHM13]
MPPFLSAASPQEALAAAAALPLVLYGYPLVESLRTCRLQTSAREATGYGRAPVNVLSASERQWTHEDRTSSRRPTTCCTSAAGSTWPTGRSRCASRRCPSASAIT